jgi:hypothetical protein
MLASRTDKCQYLLERAQDFRRFRAAAQLDHFSLREKSGLDQCSQKAPTNPIPPSRA